MRAPHASNSVGRPRCKLYSVSTIFEYYDVRGDLEPSVSQRQRETGNAATAPETGFDYSCI